MPEWLYRENWLPLLILDFTISGRSQGAWQTEGLCVPA
jgi:hypothetical protein